MDREDTTSALGLVGLVAAAGVAFYGLATGRERLAWTGTLAVIGGALLLQRLTPPAEPPPLPAP